MRYCVGMRSTALLALFAAALAAAVPNPQQFTLRNLNAGTGQNQTGLLVADASGNLFAVSTATQATGASIIRVTKADSSGNVLANFDFGGSGTDTPYAAAIDPQGNLLVGGGTTSSDFPLVSPLQNSGSGFLTKVDGALQKILYSTRVSGSTTVEAVTFDSAGNLYITGVVGADLTVTPGAFQAQAPTPSYASASLTNGFVAEISASGSTLIFSTYFSGAGVTCTNQCGSVFPAPPGPVIMTRPTAIAIDSSGRVIIAGFTNANNLPVSPNAYSRQCGCADDYSAGFAAKLGSSGTQLAWGTYIPYVQPPSGSGANLQIWPRAIALDSSGDVILAGTAPPGFPTTPGAVQPSYPPAPGPPGYPTGAGFVAKLDAAGTQLLFSTFLGGNAIGATFLPSAPSGIGGMAIDSQGRIWLSGRSATAALPPVTGAVALGQTYVAALAPDASSITALFTAPDGSAGGPVAITAQGTLAATGPANTLLISSAVPGPSLMGIVESAAAQTTQVVSAVDLVSLYGIGIGPVQALPAQISNGVIGTSLGGVQVLFDGVPAALLYAGPTQINAIVPNAVAGRVQTVMQIVTPSGISQGPVFAVRQTSPQIFKNAAGYAYAANQDGSVNSAAAPAAPGSVVSIWMTGAGANATAPDNEIDPFGVLTDSLFPISVLSNASSQQSGAELSLEVLYAGAAPLMASGVTQVNFRLPAEIRFGHGSMLLKIEAGTEISDYFEIYVQ